MNASPALHRFCNHFVLLRALKMKGPKGILWKTASLFIQLGKAQDVSRAKRYIFDREYHGPNNLFLL